MKKYVVVLLHVSYWIMYLLVVSGLLLVVDHRKVNVISPAFFGAVIPAIIGFYIFYGTLFTRYLAKKKLARLFLSIVLTSLMASAITEIIVYLFFNVDGSFATIFFSGLLIAFIALVNGIMGLIMKGFFTWYDEIRIKMELNQKNYETELALMKAQMNPHFLFNTINNIDVLIGKDPKMASDYLNKLSEMMRFMLYETKTEKIALEKELDYISRYIKLQKIRSPHANYISYTLTGRPENKMIEPMLFIPFIENAFKHALKTENAVTMSLSVEANKIIFEIANRYAKSTGPAIVQSGVGNELIRKRLSLLYPQRHTLDVNDANELYRVKLSIDLI